MTFRVALVPVRAAVMGAASAVLSVSLLLSLGGCSPVSPEPDKSAPILSPDAVLAAAERYVRTVEETLGGTRVTAGPTDNTSPCTGRDGADAGPAGPRFLFYVDQVVVPAEQHRAAVERVRALFEGQGMTVLGFRELPGIGGFELRVENPRDRFTIQVTSTSPPTAFAVWVHSPCYLPPAVSGSPAAWRLGVGAGPQTM